MFDSINRYLPEAVRLDHLIEDGITPDPAYDLDSEHCKNIILMTQHMVGCGFGLGTLELKSWSKEDMYVSIEDAFKEAYAGREDLIADLLTTISGDLPARRWPWLPQDQWTPIAHHRFVEAAARWGDGADFCAAAELVSGALGERTGLAWVGLRAVQILADAWPGMRPIRARKRAAADDVAVANEGDPARLLEVACVDGELLHIAQHAVARMGVLAEYASMANGGTVSVDLPAAVVRAVADHAVLPYAPSTVELAPFEVAWTVQVELYNRFAEIAVAADFLDAKDCIELLARAIATAINGKTGDDLRAAFSACMGVTLGSKA
jgi:hypothetical protein